MSKGGKIGKGFKPGDYVLKEEGGKKILLGFKRRWQLLQFLEILLYAVGTAVMIFALTFSLGLALCAGLIIATLIFVIRKPWGLSLEHIGNYIDRNSVGMQYSTGLLLLPRDKLSDVARLQRYEVQQTLSQSIENVHPQVSLRPAFIVFTAFAVLAFWEYSSGWAATFRNTEKLPDIQKVVFQPLDSTLGKNESPVLVSQKLTIRPPAYTELGPKHQSSMNVRALQGSRIFWNVEFNVPVDSVVWESSERSRLMDQTDNSYTLGEVVRTSGFYQFRFTTMDGTSYQSELYPLEIFEDEPPEVEIQGLKQFVSFSAEEKKIVNLKTSLSDDYGLQEAYIVATVSSGEGESVKFREERMAFDGQLEKGSKKQDLAKQIDLDKLKMVPGDELYFYVGVTDNKSPRPNTTRSETYFAVIEDTISDRFVVESTMAADLMPAYFRSQRQLIIDTEKLIAERGNISQDKFDRTSNALGADQKALRLKYGQFMGDEDDSSIQGGTISSEAMSQDTDPTAAYTHDHDAGTEGGQDHETSDKHEESNSPGGGNGHGEEHNHEESEGGEKEGNPLENYLHNHDNPEESTLFTESLKTKLRLAMQHMWDSELQLRLNTPKKSLPFQYKALKLIQEIKNSSRVYVHRIGFDAPPIKEANRLTGDFAAVSPAANQENNGKSVKFPAIRKAVERLGIIMENGNVVGNGIIIETKDRILLQDAGKELASLAVENPGKYLNTLQELRWLSDKVESSERQLIKVRDGLLQAIPPSKPDATSQQVLTGEINGLLLQELNPDD